jgi:hypothetical protein
MNSLWNHPLLHIVHCQLLSVCYFGEVGMVGEWVRAIFPWEMLNSTPRNWSGRKETALKVWGGKINHLGEKLCSTNTFWSFWSLPTYSVWSSSRYYPFTMCKGRCGRFSWSFFHPSIHPSPHPSMDDIIQGRKPWQK